MAGMSTFADPLPHRAGQFRIVAAGWPQARAVGLEDLIQAEYVARYGGPDETPMQAEDFTPPQGRFFLGYLNSDAGGSPDGDPGDTPVACGVWRTHAPGTAEIKRMFVAAGARRRGVAAAILAELERTAALAGATTILLETGDAQPEAIALYTRAGYSPIAKFGYYQCSPRSVSLAKSLTTSI